MEDIIVKPIEPIASAESVDFNPPKQTNQRIPDKSVYPFSPAPVAKQPTAPTNRWFGREQWVHLADAHCQQSQIRS